MRSSSWSIGVAILNNSQSFIPYLWNLINAIAVVDIFWYESFFYSFKIGHLSIAPPTWKVLPNFIWFWYHKFRRTQSIKGIIDIERLQKTNWNTKDNRVSAMRKGSKVITTTILMTLSFYAIIYMLGIHRYLYNYAASMPQRGSDLSHLNFIGIAVILLFSIVFGVLSYRLAKKKNRNVIGWTILGILFNLWAFLVLYSLRSKTNWDVLLKHISVDTEERFLFRSWT